MSKIHILVSGKAGHGKDTVGEYLIEQFGYVRTAFADALKHEVVSSYANAPQKVDIAFINDREIKEKPQSRLALAYCSDKDFVSVALKAFEKEDQELFDKLSRTLDFHFPGDGPRATAMKALMTEGSFTLEERLQLPRSPRRITQVWGTEYRRADNDAYWVEKVDEFISASDAPAVICDGRFLNETTWAKEAGVKRIHVVKVGDEEGAKVASHASENIPAPCDETFVIYNDFSKGLPSLYAQVADALNNFASQHAAKRHLRAA